MIRSGWKVGFSYSGRTTSLTTDWVVWTLLALPCHLMSSHSSCGQLSNISQNSCPSCLPNVSPGIHSALLSFFLVPSRHTPVTGSYPIAPPPDENNSSQVLSIIFRHRLCQQTNSFHIYPQNSKKMFFNPTS